MKHESRRHATPADRHHSWQPPEQVAFTKGSRVDRRATLKQRCATREDASSFAVRCYILSFRCYIPYSQLFSLCCCPMLTSGATLHEHSKHASEPVAHCCYYLHACSGALSARLTAFVRIHLIKARLSHAVHPLCTAIMMHTRDCHKHPLSLSLITKLQLALQTMNDLATSKRGR